MATQTVLAASGDIMVANALRQAEPDVMAAYPITPQTIIVEEFDKFVADGRVHTEYVNVESEHSAMSATIGASAAGSRAVTATSSQGLALMYEELPIAAGMRLPIVMANVNRTISAPINIHADHSDIMGVRDAGWIVMFAENAQEAYDNTVCAFRIAENPQVMLPVLTTLDGFTTSHAYERCELMDDATVAEFVGTYEAPYGLLTSAQPIAHGNYANGTIVMESKLACRRAQDAAKPVIDEVFAAWSQICGREMACVHTYGMEDAERAIVIIGSAAGTVRHVARQLRAEGERVGVVNIRVFRPFPAGQIVEALKGCSAVAVLDRSESFGGVGGPVAAEVKASMYDAGLTVPVRAYMYGLGGADLTCQIVRDIYNELKDPASLPSLTYKGNR